MLACWSIKGGVGTTVVAVGLAVALAARSGPSVLMADLGGDVPGVFGALDPGGPGLAEWSVSGTGVSAEALDRLEVSLTPRIAVAPRGAGPMGVDRADDLIEHLRADPREVVVDAGVPGEGTLSVALCHTADVSLLVVRACPLSLARLAELPVAPTGVIVVRDRRRLLSWREVADACTAPVVAELELDPRVAGAVDVGVGRRSLPRGFVRALAALT
jgi:MinD superfamily P-loop ATPase